VSSLDDVLALKRRSPREALEGCDGERLAAIPGQHPENELATVRGRPADFASPADRRERPACSAR